MWHLKTFEQLTHRELYEILRLRSEVFVVEQECVYLDIDGYDIDDCHHLFAVEGHEITAYTRILAPGTTYRHASIGRVVTNARYRQKGLGKKLMKESIRASHRLYPDHDIKIGAQTYLMNFYSSLGFVPIGDPYMEDGIEHIHMIYSINDKT